MKKKPSEFLSQCAMEIAHGQQQVKKDHNTAKNKTLNLHFQQQAHKDMNEHFLRECEKIEEQSKR